MRLIKTPSGKIAAIIKAGYDKDEKERTVQVSTGTADPAEAKKIIEVTNLESIEVLAKAGKLSSTLLKKLTTGGNITLRAAIDEWIPWLRDRSNSDRTADSNIMWVERWYEDECPHWLIDVTEKSLSDYINRKDGAKRGTKKTKLAALRSFFKFCSIRDYLNPDPSAGVMVKHKLLTQEQKEQAVRVLYTDKDIQKILDHLLMVITDTNREIMSVPTPAKQKRLRHAWFWYCAVLIGRYAGFRLGDIATLEWTSITKAGTLVVWTEKRDSRVQIPITGPLEQAIEALQPSGKKECFPEMAAIHRGKRRAFLSVSFGRILRAVGLYGNGYVFHGLRMTLASELNANGTRIEDIAEALGHRNTKVTEGYIKPVR